MAGVPLPAASTSSPRIRPVPAVRKAIAILEYLAEHNVARGVSRISRDVDILPSTGLHILRELAQSALVSFNPEDKTYSLGPGVLTLARNYQDRDAFAREAQIQVDRIGDEFGVKATASVFDGHRSIVVVATNKATDELQVQIHVGRTVPMLASSTGRCVAAFNPMTETQLKAAFKDTTWQTPLPFDVWLRQVGKVRKDKLAIDEDCYRKGMTLISVPVFSPDGSARRFVGALAITAQLSAARKRGLAAALRAAALRLTGAL